jgi:tRNA threonylcarbamoyl adenosine modification protein (Sua5/YciO/YrdC/YwlC family)
LTQRFVIHPSHPQLRLLRQAAELMRAGAVVALPTDACYVLACSLDNADSVARMRAIRQLDDKHLLTLMCRDLSELASYAQIDNWQFRFLKEWTPGAYTFILPATRKVPRKIWHPSRKTIGLRVPGSTLIDALLGELSGPVLCTSLIMPQHDQPLQDPDEIVQLLNRRIELVIDVGAQGLRPTTVIDLTGSEPLVQRIGVGDVRNMTHASGTDP